MNMNGRLWLLAAAVSLAGSAAAQSVRTGVDAWQAGRYDEAVRNWQPLAERGDADAQFNLGHAYRLGRGVPQNLGLAEQMYARAARSGHEEAQAMYGMLLFQNGRRQEAMPYIERAAERGDPRAQYVLGTALFNGDLVARDWPRAYALMTRAAAQGLPPAATQLQEMERHLSAQDRARGVELARAMDGRAPTHVAAANPSPIVTRPPTVQTVRVPPAQTQRPPVVRPAEPAPAPTPAPAAAVGRWRVQLGAFSSEANARRAWSAVSGRLPGLQPYLVRAGALTRLQAGPLASRAAADRACTAVRGAGQACFAVAP